jgi:putative restriction endonuclease
MPKKNLAHYLQMFTHLRTDRTAGWTDATQGQAPHKPILLLSVLDLFAQRRIASNLIEITPELGELFASYWSTVMPPERRGNMALPFFHLRSSRFWHLVPLTGQDSLLETVRQVDTLSRLSKLVLGARLDEDLYLLMQYADSRNALRTALIQTYFAPNFHTTMLTLGDVNLQAFIYSQHLIEQSRKRVKETIDDSRAYQAEVRDQGFRRAVVRIYCHRCAFCGVRMLTSDGHTAVDAAHIVPWSISHDDDPQNGMALCRLCHWTFDEGLLGVSTNYLVMISQELRVSQNVSGHLLTLENRSIIGPGETDLWPGKENLDWHLHKIYRG